jgi:hypothetical protein
LLPWRVARMPPADPETTGPGSGCTEGPPVRPCEDELPLLLLTGVLVPAWLRADVVEGRLFAVVVVEVWLLVDVVCFLCVDAVSCFA